MNLVPIGQFSKMTLLSVNALRLYDDNGLLPPAYIDPSSGYRYYDLTQAGRAEMVRALRSVDMPLDEIALVIDADNSDIALKHLHIHQDRLGERIESQKRMLNHLETLIKNEEGLMSYEIEIAEAQPQLIAATRRSTTLAMVGQAIGSGFGALMQAMAKNAITPAGSPLIVYHDIIDQETSGDLEMCVPISGGLTSDDEVYSRELEGGAMATTIHRGPYEQISAAYLVINEWIPKNGYDIAGPPRETYLNDPQMVAPADLLTKIEFPVCPKSA